MKPADFLDQVFSNVWETMSPDAISQYYHQDVVAKMGDQVADYQDIVKRCEYVKTHYSSLRNHVLLCMGDEHEITAYCKQVLTRRSDGCDDVFHMLIRYELSDHKVKTIHATFSPAFDYFEHDDLVA
jgi:hypothetical protein